MDFKSEKKRENEYKNLIYDLNHQTNTKIRHTY